MEYPTWQATSISGVLRHAKSLGEGWWYRIQLADELIAYEVFEQTEVFGKPLRHYAMFWFPLPRDIYHVVWAPQWVPAESVSEDMEMAFWKRMPLIFWSLAKFINEDVIWREEVEQFVSLSGNTSEHLCIRRGCIICKIKSGLRRSLSFGMSA